MADQFKHKRYFRIRAEDSTYPKYGTYTTLESVDQAKNLINFKTAYNTSSPTVTGELQDSNQTLVLTYEFDTQEQQDLFKSAVDAEWGESSAPFTNTSVEHFKTEWLHPDGSISATDNL